jgi:hypothetical protein
VGFIVKNFDRPDARPELPKGHAELIQIGEQPVIRGVLEPGWRWSNDWRPMMGTASCEIAHLGVVLSGRMHFEMDDGTGLDAGPDDVYSVPPGHDAWVLGDEPVVTIDFSPPGEPGAAAAIEAGTANAG